MSSTVQISAITDPLAALLVDFGHRRATLDTVFLKFNIPEIGAALLIDFSIRRRQRRGLFEVRAMLVLPSGTHVETTNFPIHSIRREPGHEIEVANIFLSPSGTRGKIQEISWDIAFDTQGQLVDPQVTGHSLRPFDLRMQSVPGAQMSGNVRFGTQNYISFAREPGMVGAYYGRWLPKSMYIISASAFNVPETTVECVFLESSFFGLPFFRLWVGHLYLRRGTESMTVMHPLTGQLQLTGGPGQLEIQARPRQGGSVKLSYTVKTEHYTHLGDQMYATLYGDCVLDNEIHCDGQAMCITRRV
jgi:hypothetical protein